MQKSAYSAKNFIKNRSSFESYECVICFELNTQLVKCKGPCQKVFCIECVSQTKNVSDRCPNRCSKPFFACKLPTLKFQFACPFSSFCQLPILTVQDFHQHHLVCDFTPPQEKVRRRLKQQYKCPKEHSLQFFIGKYNEMVSSICAQCSQQKLCRSICRKCDQKYCIECRMPPCSKKRCPIGHAFALFKDCNLQYICDVCGMNASIFNTGIYDDKACNFGICQNCIQKLPEERNNKHLTRLVNNQEKCECGSTLLYANEGKQSCSMCERTKSCPKYCPNCKLNYCLKCKNISIYDDICEFQHQFIAIMASEYLGTGCMRCDKTAAVYLQDSQCGITLCGECKDYFYAITTDKQRLRPVYCDEGHKLCLMKRIQRQCKKCKVAKNIELICLQCEGKEIYYCFQCKTIPLDTCYFDHPLTTAPPESTQIRTCSICSQQHSEHKACKRCKFYVCSPCHSLNSCSSSLLGQFSQLSIN